MNLSNDFIRVNCGARYIFNMKAENIRVMCWRDTFLKLDRNFIDDFLSNVFFYRENTRELMASSYNPKSYEDLVAIPANILWHNSLQFNISPKLWAEKYADILMPSVLDFSKDCIKKSSIMTQMQQAHSTGLIELINKKMNKNQIQPEYVKEKSTSSQGDSQMENPQDKLINETKTLLENTKNLILTGAPGTGKTYLAKQIAKAMGCTENEIGFVQFHQSYDYTDFVEGLRPVQNDGNNQIGFERKDGVFKEFCAKALKSIFYDSNENVDNFEECWKKLVDELDENNFVIIPLISGKGDFRVELNEYGTGLANRTYENDDFQKGNWIQGKSKFFSKDQLYNIYQGLPGTPAGGHDNYRKAVIEYMKKNLGLMDYKKSETKHETKKNFVFIIDEINRGEVSKIFGELFYCVDPGYRGERGRINTQYQNLISGGEFQKGFFIPENVYIIGTMNDIDRSVESMDFAFRRRFAWKEIKASGTVEMLYPGTDEDGKPTGLESYKLAEEAKERMNRLNEEISKVPELNSAYHIGASYFLKLKNYENDSDNGFQSLWNYHLKGILEEYLRGNPAKDDLMKTLKAAYAGEAVTNEG